MPLGGLLALAVLGLLRLIGRAVLSASPLPPDADFAGTTANDLIAKVRRGGAGCPTASTRSIGWCRVIMDTLQTRGRYLTLVKRDFDHVAAIQPPCS